MNNIETLNNIISKLNSEATRKEDIKAEYKEKEKTKALTTAERLDRIEKLLGIK